MGGVRLTLQSHTAGNHEQNKFGTLGLCHTIFFEQGTQKFHRVLDVGVKLLWPGTALSDGVVNFLRRSLSD